jgi:uncharacterized membrane protein
VNSALEVWKTAHILSAAILFGTGLGIAFFCWFGSRGAMRSGEIGTLRTVLRLTVIADAWLTAPAVAFQAMSGLALMRSLGWPLVSSWSIAVWCLYGLVGVCWLPVVAIQVRLKLEAERVSSVGALSPQFHRAFRWWFALGIPAFITVVALFYIMVAKPLAVGGL